MPVDELPAAGVIPLVASLSRPKRRRASWRKSSGRWQFWLPSQPARFPSGFDPLTPSTMAMHRGAQWYRSAPVASFGTATISQ